MELAAEQGTELKRFPRATERAFKLSDLHALNLRDLQLASWLAHKVEIAQVVSYLCELNNI